MLSQKKHILVFITSAGDFVVATDNLDEVTQQRWFNELLVTHGPPKIVKSESLPGLPSPPQPPPQQPRLQPQRPAPVRTAQSQAQYDVSPVVNPVPPSSFLDIMPDKMAADMWKSLTVEQQGEWMAHHNIRT